MLAGRGWGLVWVDGRGCFPGRPTGCRLEPTGCAVWLWVCVEGRSKCGPKGGAGRRWANALSKRGGSENGRIRPRLFLPQLLFPEEAPSPGISVIALGQQGHAGMRHTWVLWCPCLRLMCQKSGSHHLPSKPQSLSGLGPHPSESQGSRALLQGISVGRNRYLLWLLCVACELYHGTLPFPFPS